MYFIQFPAFCADPPFHVPPTPLFFVFLPGARPGARLVVALHCVHNNALSIGAGAGQDILPRHFIIMTIVKLGSPRIPG